MYNVNNIVQRRLAVKGDAVKRGTNHTVKEVMGKNTINAEDELDHEHNKLRDVACILSYMKGTERGTV